MWVSGQTKHKKFTINPNKQKAVNLLLAANFKKKHHAKRKNINFKKFIHKRVRN